MAEYQKLDFSSMSDEELIKKERELDKLYKQLNLTQLGLKVCLNSQH